MFSKRCYGFVKQTLQASELQQMAVADTYVERARTKVM